MTTTQTLKVTCDCRVCQGRAATARDTAQTRSYLSDPRHARTLRHNIVANAYGPMGRVLGYLPTDSTD